MNYTTKTCCKSGIVETESPVDGKYVFATIDSARFDAVRRVRKQISKLVKKEEGLEAMIFAWEAALAEV
jgi:hypothetical protein